MTTVLDRIGGPDDLSGLSSDELLQLADDIRDRIVEVMPRNGGHFGSSLGVVELTIALHRVFDFSVDRLTLDVSHQCYPHKMLTGRNEDYNHIRTKGGPAGYTRPSESPYDSFMWAHAGTSISTALGMARGMRADDGWGVAVIGDSSINSGVALEALVHSGVMPDEKLLIILNDNNMSIAPTVGALSNHFKATTEAAKESGPADGKGKNDHLGGFFTSLGHRYIGPIDGHNIDSLIELLDEIRTEGRSTVLHVQTVKGRGHIEAEKDQWKWHAVGGAKKPEDDAVDFERVGKTPYTDIFVESMIRRAKVDPDLETITAAMPCGTGLRHFAAEFPDRCYDTGIAESHAIAFAAGLAHTGKNVVAAIYSTFLQRAYDQLFQEIALNANPVLLALDRAGIVGPDGATHNGCFDIAYIRSLPRIAIMAPRDATEMDGMLNLALDAKLPTAIRYPRAAAPASDREYESTATLEWGKSETLRHGADVALIAYGSMVYPAMEAAETMAGLGIEATVVNARFVRPLDREMLQSVLEQHPLICTIEEHTTNGGLGSACLEEAARSRWATDRLYPIGLPDAFVEHGTRTEMLDEVGLTPRRLVQTITAQLSEVAKRSQSKFISEAKNY